MVTSKTAILLLSSNQRKGSSIVLEFLLNLVKGQQYYLFILDHFLTFKNCTISLRIQRETKEQFASLSISNEIVPFSSVYIETSHAVFKSCRFQSHRHLMPVTKTF